MNRYGHFQLAVARESVFDQLRMIAVLRQYISADPIRGIDGYGPVHHPTLHAPASQQRWLHGITADVSEA